jgi:prevent-host-death family protein
VSSRYAVKDSFARLDLVPDGFKLLFEAQWIARAPAAAESGPPGLSWGRVTDARELGRWEAAWAQGDTAGGPLFRPGLLTNPRCVRSPVVSHKLAILIAMSVSEQMPLADVKNHLSEVVDRLQREHGRVIITRHGHAAAVVMSVEDLESLEETLDIMDSAALLCDIRESLAELGTANAPVLTKDDALRLISGQ